MPDRGVHGKDNPGTRRRNDIQRRKHRDENDPPDRACRPRVASRRWCVPEGAPAAPRLFSCGAVADVCEVDAPQLSFSVEGCFLHLGFCDGSQSVILQKSRNERANGFRDQSQLGMEVAQTSSCLRILLAFSAGEACFSKTSGCSGSKPSAFTGLSRIYRFVRGLYLKVVSPSDAWTCITCTCGSPPPD